MAKQFKVIVEKHSDGYVAYLLGFEAIVVGEGNTYEEAIQDVKSAIQSHLETFGGKVMDDFAMIIAIQEGEEGECVSREVIFQVLIGEGKGRQ